MALIQFSSSKYHHYEMSDFSCAFFWIYLWDPNIFPWGFEAKSKNFGKKSLYRQKSEFFENSTWRQCSSSKCQQYEMCGFRCAFFWIYLCDQNIFPWSSEANFRFLAKKAYTGKNPRFWKIRPEDNVLAQSVNSTKCVVWGVLSSENICETKIFSLGAPRQNQKILAKKPI